MLRPWTIGLLRRECKLYYHTKRALLSQSYFASYQFNAAVNLATVTTLNGTCGEIFVFQITYVISLSCQTKLCADQISLSDAFNLAAEASIILIGGVTSSTIFWQVGGAFTAG